MPLFYTLFLSIVLWMPFVLSAQKNATENPKFRITYTTADSTTKKQIGFSPQIQGQSLMLQEWGGSDILRFDVDKIQVIHIHKREKAGLKAVFGLGIGLTVGYLLAKIGEPHCSSPNPCDGYSELRTPAFVVSGGFVGLIIGGVFLPSKWEKVELHNPLFPNSNSD